MREHKILLVTGASSEVGCKLICDVADQYEIILAHYCHCAEPLMEIKNEIGDKLILLEADFSNLDQYSQSLSKISFAFHHQT